MPVAPVAAIVRTAADSAKTFGATTGGPTTGLFEMTDSLGLSIGMTNLVAARVGAAPVTRRAILTLYPDRVAEVGLPSENPNLTEPGVVLEGFVERVGDPVPLVASDGSTHRADQLLVEALDAMTRTVSNGLSRVAIAVPAHWGPAVLGALRGALRTKPNLSPNGVPPVLVSDAAAALAALNTTPGLPAAGIVALLDFGGSGTSITFADAGNELAPIDETLRYAEFSGAQIDQMLLAHVLADIGPSSSADTAGTTAVGALSQLREQCRQAKERLSAETAAQLSAELPGYHSDIRVTRAELENLISGPLSGAIRALEEMLQRNRIPAESLSAVATVGGGAAIPLITQRLSEHFRVPVVTTPQPALNTAAGAALLAAGGLGGDMPTGLAAAADAPTGMATAAWATGAAAAATTESAADGPASATFRALAWSEDQGGDEPVPYSGADYAYDPEATSARPQMEFSPASGRYPQPPAAPPAVAEEPLSWYRRPPVLFAAALIAVLALTGGLAWTLTSKSSPIRSPRTSTATAPAVTNPEAPGVPLTETMTITGTDGSPTVVTPATSTTAPEATTSSSATTTPSTTTTTTTTTQATTTTTQPTTTQPTTTTTTQPPTTTTQPPTTTQAPPTTTAKPPTTSVASFTTPQTVTTPPAVATTPPAVATTPPAIATTPPAVATTPPAVVTTPQAIVPTPPKPTVAAAG